ncbi:M4 family metallopeptidase [Flavobacterium columnare]|uniref:M4 family metallopeptidase n=1 Tax=Flavobacterium columnare TaxID=996 RepID=UPI002D217079|nr:M4 family metallopeptidase [Flavobacterium columnare]MEB3800384.1 M4 family metallopeptidase [Flavobacterium columnare]
MKKNYIALFSILSMISNLQAQENAKFESKKEHQKTLRMDKASSREKALDAIEKTYGLGKENQYKISSVTSDITGLTHQRHQQYYKGLKVEFGTVITHEKNGLVELVNAELYNAKSLDLTPKLSAQRCFQYALDYANAEKYLWENPEQSKVFEYEKPKGELVIFPDTNSGKIYLAYKYDIYSVKPISRKEYYINANTGALLYTNPLIKHFHKNLVSKDQIKRTGKQIENIILPSALASGNAATRYSGNRSIETTFDTNLNRYILSDATRGKGIVTYNCANGNYANSHFTDDDNNWTAAEFHNAAKDDAGLDAHWGALKTYDFWKTIFNRDSFDNKGSVIKSYVNLDLAIVDPTNSSSDNAFWDGQFMSYGKGTDLDALTAVDICGHEIGHAVCTYTADLAYKNQSGAMNEGFSDIWGACIEQYAKNGNLNAAADTASPGTLNVWKLGEDIGTSLRSMSYPNTKRAPDTFLGLYYVDTQDDTGVTPECADPNEANDQCGVHTNSGVLNHWFYILTAGKSGTNNASLANGGQDVYNVQGIGMTKAAQIAYYAERDYLTPNSTFMDCRNATIAVANSLYCASSPEVQSVTNAWYAVNVGSAYNAVANDIVLKSLQGGNLNVNCGASYNPIVTFENGGSNIINAATITYNIDGGASSTLNWSGNLAQCQQATEAININGLTRGYHILNVTTNITNDGLTTNNTKSMVILVNDSGNIGSINTFNTANDALISVDKGGKSNTVWERGIVNKTNLSVTATGNSPGYATKLVGNYPDKTTSYLVSQCYNLSNLTNARVSFDMAFDLESNWDIIYFEYSTNNGATWTPLGEMNNTWYNSSRMPNGVDCFNCIGKQWTGDYHIAPSGGNGNNGNKRNYSQSLTEVGPASNAIFRFTFISDDASNQEGVFIDNFVIQGTLGNEINNFEYFEISPNPSNGKFDITLSTDQEVKVKIFDLGGRNVFERKYEVKGSVFNNEIDLSNISSGVYILNIESKNKKESRRIIIN